MPKVYGGIKEQRQKSFQDILKAAFDSVNKMQNDYDEVLRRQITDENIDIHDVVIAGEKAKLSLELTLQIRNKAIEAYQEIMRMQV
ncbi:flagellar hook-basal body complex protein FliE [Thermoanaerobacteraceae bacterium SP2]|jgi:flagellar hook-basal body complex protein FliE|nr:flagellar hook-basal body complex protein FliE [Thermoanaerobacteraceae bacterium SP2]